jgi:hypothetical protein
LLNFFLIAYHHRTSIGLDHNQTHNHYNIQIVRTLLVEKLRDFVVEKLSHWSSEIGAAGVVIAAVVVVETVKIVAIVAVAEVLEVTELVVKVLAVVVGFVEDHELVSSAIPF